MLNVSDEFIVAAIDAEIFINANTNQTDKAMPLVSVNNAFGVNNFPSENSLQLGFLSIGIDLWIDAIALI